MPFSKASAALVGPSKAVSASPGALPHMTGKTLIVRWGCLIFEQDGQVFIFLFAKLFQIIILRLRRNINGRNLFKQYLGGVPYYMATVVVLAGPQKNQIDHPEVCKVGWELMGGCGFF
jgi:hypothetical protein